MADLRSKALAYYRDGHVHVLYARTLPDQRAPLEVVAVVEGHTGTRRVEHTNGTWTCTCKTVIDDGQPCAHLAAVQLCTDPASSAAAKPAKASAAA